ncbi:MAG: ABC transporter permease [Planctomycetota bacterium]
MSDQSIDPASASSQAMESATAANPISLGGGDGEAPYHPLAMDVEQSGAWGGVDRISRGFGEWLNPILVKEARQSLKSRQFIITFFLLLVASCSWTILGVVVNAPDVYYLPTGDSLIVGYYFVLAIPMIGMVPLAAHRSLAAEIDDDTFEMLVITKLTSLGIVLGKMTSAILQMLIYFAAIVPCLAFTYLLRGIDLPTIVMMIIVVFFTALLVTSACLMLATLAPSRAGQTLALLAALGLIVFAEFLCGAFNMEVILRQGLGSDSEGLLFTSIFVVIGASCIAVFLKAAAARIAPVTENRSTGLRYLMLLQQLLWCGSMALIILWYEDLEVLNFSNMVIAGYWLLMGSIMLAESPELSPRVQRGLPSTVAGRVLRTWFNPGPGTGFVYAITTGSTGVAVMALFGTLVPYDRAPRTDSITFAMIVIGYLAGYLGIVRLISMPLCRRFGRMLTLPVGTLATVLMLALVSPTVLMVATTGAPARSYTPIEAVNWGWTLIESFERRF